MAKHTASGRPAGGVDALVGRALSYPTTNAILTRAIVGKVASLKDAFGLTHLAFVHKNEKSYASLFASL